MGYEPAAFADVCDDAGGSSNEEKAERVYSHAEVVCRKALSLNW